MLDTPQLVETPRQFTAYLPLTIPRAEIRKVMGPGLAEVKAAVAAQGLTAVGPWFTHHLRVDPDVFDFEIRVPLSGPMTDAGRVKGGEWPAMKNVARAIYRGPYEGLGAAWGEFGAWLQAHGHAPAAGLWECYVAGPESSPDPATWRTELNRRLAS